MDLNTHVVASLAEDENVKFDVLMAVLETAKEM